MNTKKEPKNLFHIPIILFLIATAGCSSLDIDPYPAIPEKLIYKKTIDLQIIPQKVLYNEIAQTFIVLGSEQNIIYLYNKKGQLLQKISKFKEIDEFGYVSDIAIDSAGNIYALDSVFNQIMKFDEMGQYISQISLTQTREPELLEIKNNGDFLVYDAFTNEIYCLSYTKQLRYTFGKFQLINPVKISSSLDFNYVLDKDNNTILIFDNFGSLINNHYHEKKILSLASSKYFIFYLNSNSEIYTGKQDYIISRILSDLSGLAKIKGADKLFIRGTSGLGVTAKSKIHLFQFSQQ